MPVFEYVTTDTQGRTQRNTIQARDRTAAILDLRDRGVFTTEVSLVGATEAEKAAAAERRAAFKTRFLDPIFFRVSARRLSHVFHELASTGNAGMVLNEALDMLARGPHPPRLRYVLSELRDAIRRGEPLSEQMTRFPTIFPELSVALVQAGEKSGNMPEMFRAIADWLDYEISVRTKMFTATLYPKIVLLVAAFVVLFLPLAGTVVARPILAGLPCLGVTVGAFLLWVLYKGSERWLEQFSGWRRGWDEVKLAVPIIGQMMRKFASARFATTLGTLYRAGVLLPTAVEHAADACGNIAMRDRLKVAIPALMAGNPLAESLAQTRQLKPSVISLIATGEKTGDLDTLLASVSKYLTEEADATAQRMVPVLFVGTFLVVALLVLLVLIQFYSGALGGHFGEIKEMLE